MNKAILISTTAVSKNETLLQLVKCTFKSITNIISVKKRKFFVSSIPNSDYTCNFSAETRIR